MPKAFLMLMAALAPLGIASNYLVAQSPQSPQGVAGKNPRLTNCVVSIKEEVEVPAQEAGVLVSLEVVEGMRVKSGQLLGNIDDSERQSQKKLAEIERKAAREQADNDINVRYSIAAAKVAEAEFQQSKTANAKVKGTYPLAEVRRLELAWNKATLQIEQSEVERRVAQYTADTRAAEVEVAEQNIARRKLLAPFDGEVVTVLKHAGEWAQPGESVLHIMRFNVLRVEGFLDSQDYDPAEVSNRPVMVEVSLARGRPVKLPGKITYVSPQVQSDGTYRVYADVVNREENKQWVLRPGMTATMTIEL